MAITDTHALETYLQSANIPYTALEPLSGGTANYIWRLTQASGKTVVIKHAEPYVATNPSMAFPVARMRFEATALTKLPTVVSADDVVRLPRLERYDEERHVLIMEDGGKKTLKEAYADTTTSIPSLGTHLGIWLSTLHTTTSLSSCPSILPTDNKIARSIYRHAYTNLASALAQHNLSPTLGQTINEQFGALLDTDDECLCQGDFWPGNVLLSSGDRDSGGDSERRGGELERGEGEGSGREGGTGKGRLVVVDWEMVRRGCGATDVGQFVAEAWLLDRWRGGRGLLGAFLEGYCATSPPLSKRFFKRVAIHFGTHLVFWPTRVTWADEEGTTEIVRFGAAVLERALEEDWDWLGRSVLGVLLR